MYQSTTIYVLYMHNTTYYLYRKKNKEQQVVFVLFLLIGVFVVALQKQQRVAKQDRPNISTE